MLTPRLILLAAVCLSAFSQTATPFRFNDKTRIVIPQVYHGYQTVALDVTCLDILNKAIPKTAYTFKVASTFDIEVIFNSPTTGSCTPTPLGGLNVPLTRKVRGDGTTIGGGGALSQDQVLAVIPNSSNQRVRVYKDGVFVGERRGINLKTPAGATLPVADNATTDLVDVQLPAGGTGGSGNALVSTQSFNAPSGGDVTVNYGFSTPVAGVLVQVEDSSGPIRVPMTKTHADVVLHFPAGVAVSGTVIAQGIAVGGASSARVAFTVAAGATAVVNYGFAASRVLAQCEDSVGNVLALPIAKASTSATIQNLSAQAVTGFCVFSAAQ